MNNNENNNFNNNVNNTMNNNNAIPMRKPFNTGKNIGILVGVSFLIFMIGTMATMFLTNMSVETEMQPMISFLTSLASIMKFSIPVLILMIGIPAILIVGSKNKSNK